MKILSLKALNINSLKGLSEINFSKLLKEQALFAIIGPTGSGKSTLLDIISCALYAKTARLKNPNELMSRHTGEAFCEVEFEIKKKVYRSSWSQKRARKKHDGKFQSAKMELSEALSGKIIETGLIEVPRHIQELSGLDFGRFTQSMMLAQGSFDAFLKADEKERSALLEKITGTQIYAEISKAVHVSYSEYQKEIAMQSASLESITLLDEKLTEEKEQKLLSQKKQKLPLDKQLTKSTSALHWVKTLSVLTDDFKKYQEKFALISKEKEDKKEDFIKLDLADRALHVSTVYSEKKHLQNSLSSSNTSLVSRQEELLKASEDIAQKEQSYQEILKSTQEAEKEFQTQNEKLKTARNIQVQVQESEKSIQALEIWLQTKESQEKQLSLHVESINKNFDGFEKELSNKKKYLDKNGDDAKLLADLSAIEQILKQFYDEESNNKTAKSEFSDIQKRAQKKQNTLTILKSEIEVLTLTCKMKEQELLLQKYEKDRAKLKEGEACFLCGALEHPYLKHAPNNAHDSSQDTVRQELQRAIKQKQNKEEKHNTLRIEISNTQAKIEQLHLTIKTSNKKLETLIQNLQSYSKSFHAQNLQTHYQKLLKRQKEYKDALKSVQKIEEKILTCKLDKKESETKLLSLITEFSDNKQRLQELKTRLKSLEKERISILNIADLETYEKEINLTCKAKQKTQQDAKNALEALQIRQTEQIKQENSLAQKIIEDQKQLQKLSLKLQEQLKENNFTSEKELENASLSHKDYESLSLTCKEIQRQYTQINTLKIETEKKLKLHQKKPLTTKPTGELELELKALQESSDTLQRDIGSLETELEINRKNKRQYEEKTAHLQKKKESFKIYSKLQELIGSADGTKFKKFAQGVTLDQLINLANIQLDNLSERYTLARSSQEKQMLELEVIDAFQGNVSRSVNTLSGGESFIVSLALALGLSSLASQKIAIDSLFLDEGFGTLDAQSLETALNALNLLQSSGKMVGIISHVEALKERIPLQIKVIPNGDGTSYIEK